MSPSAWRSTTMNWPLFDSSLVSISASPSPIFQLGPHQGVFTLFSNAVNEPGAARRGSQEDERDGQCQPTKH